MKKRGMKLRLLLLLALAVLATSLAATGTLAKYVSEFTATGSMEVASFAGGGTVNFDVALADMVPGELQTVNFVVCNYESEKQSDVGILYEIQVESTGNLPLEFSLLGKSNGGKGALVGTLDSGGKATGGKLPYYEDGGAKHSYELSVFWPDTKNSEAYSHEIDMVTVTITAIQEEPEWQEASASEANASGVSSES